MIRAILLAAGQGTRLAPLTNDRPKCLVPLAGRTLLDRARDSLAHAGVTDLWVVAGYRAELISAAGYRTVVNERFAHTNMVASLFSARHLLDGTCDVLIVYGDIVFEHRVVAALAQSAGWVSVAVNEDWQVLWSVRMAHPLSDAETLRKNEGGFITEIGKRPRAASDIEGQYMGLIKLSADSVGKFCRAYDGMDRRLRYDGVGFDQLYMTGFLQYLIDAGWPVAAVAVRGGWLEVDTIEDLRLYEDLAAQGSLDQYCVLN